MTRKKLNLIPMQSSLLKKNFHLPVYVHKEGKNTVAVEIHQDGEDSSDLWLKWVLQVSAKTV